MGISNISIPHICSGTIFKHLDSGTYEVKLTKTPIGEFIGCIHARLISPDSLSNTYQFGDAVKVLVHFNITEDTFEIGSVNHKHGAYILGHHRERSIIDIPIEHPTSAADPNQISFVNKRTGAGIVTTNEGHMTLCSGGISQIVFRTGGYGCQKDKIELTAQNHSKAIFNGDDMMLNRESFGAYHGASIDEESANITPDSRLVNYRRFVCQSGVIDKYVSTCEGAYYPFFGPNNTGDTVRKNKESLYTQIVNAGTKRITSEKGASAKEFSLFRIDDIILLEQASPIGYLSAVGGYRFKSTISDTGAMEIRGGGSGTPGANINKYHIAISDKGEATFDFASTAITGQGLKFNSKTLITKDYLTYDNQVKTSLSTDMTNLSTAFTTLNIAMTALLAGMSALPGMAALITPVVTGLTQVQTAITQLTTDAASALTNLTKGIPAPQSAGGFTTFETVPTIINDVDSLMT